MKVLEYLKLQEILPVLLDSLNSEDYFDEWYPPVVIADEFSKDDCECITFPLFELYNFNIHNEKRIDFCKYLLTKLNEAGFNIEILQIMDNCISFIEHNDRIYYEQQRNKGITNA